LKALLNDDKLLLRIRAAEALWRISGDEKMALPVVRRGLESGDRSLRVKSCQILAAMGSAANAAIPALKELLEDPERDVRAAAASALQKLQ